MPTALGIPRQCKRLTRALHLCFPLAYVAQVGDISVVRFGESVTLEHALGTPWTNSVAARVVTSFDFKAKLTNIVGALELTQEVFERSRGSSGNSGAAGQPLQLAFFMSDGIVDKDDRPRLRTLVRDYASKNVLLVLLILDKDAKSDSFGKMGAGGACGEGEGGEGGADGEGGGLAAAAPAAQAAPGAEKVHSILDTTSLAWVNGKPVFTSYMDDFPFPYYIIVRNINALPEVLADALRQWFEMVQAK